MQSLRDQYFQLPSYCRDNCLLSRLDAASSRYRWTSLVSCSCHKCSSKHNMQSVTTVNSECWQHRPRLGGFQTLFGCRIDAAGYAIAVYGAATSEEVNLLPDALAASRPSYTAREGWQTCRVSQTAREAVEQPQAVLPWLPSSPSNKHGQQRSKVLEARQVARGRCRPRASRNERLPLRGKALELRSSSTSNRKIGV